MSDPIMTDMAIAVRDRVNSHSEDRLKLLQVEQRKDGLARMLFMDSKAPTEFWSDIDGAYCVVYWKEDTTLDEVVQTILNGQPGLSEEAPND